MQDQLTRELARLAALSRLEYERERNDAAKHLRVRVRELDLEVEKLRSRHQAKRPAAKEPPTWAPPEKLWTAPVAGAELLGELIDAIRRFVILDQTSALVAALWVLFTWVFEHVAETNPFLRIISPAPECGKSTLLKVLKRLARSGWIVSRITASAFTRSIGAERRTLLLDEGDAFLHENEVMRNVLDGASDPDTANISLSVKSGDEWKPAEFNVFVPIAIASIRVLPKMQTVEDRSIAINLKRATRAELKQLAKGRRRELEAVLGPLAEKCARWAADSAEKLKGARPQMPEVLSGRDQDKWEPLIAIADAIGVEAGKDARVAAITVSNARDVGSVSLGEELLADIRAIFDEKATDKLSSRAICEALAAIEGRPWAEYGKARKPVTQNQLARLLRPFVIVPHTIRLANESTPKGYERKDFEDAWARYLDAGGPISDDSNRHNATTAGAVSENDDSASATEAECGGSKNGNSSHGEKGCGSAQEQDDFVIEFE